MRYLISVLLLGCSISASAQLKAKYGEPRATFMKKVLGQEITSSSDTSVFLYHYKMFGINGSLTVGFRNDSLLSYVFLFDRDHLKPAAKIAKAMDKKFGPSKKVFTDSPTETQWAPSLQEIYTLSFDEEETGSFVFQGVPKK